MGNFVNILLWLSVAFLLGDYPLQTKYVFAFRYRYKFGVLLHVGIHFLVGAILLLPYLLNWRIWTVLVVTNGIHYFVDRIVKNNIWQLIADQSAHVAVIFGGSFFAAGAVAITLPEPVARYYFSTDLPLYLIGYLAATYMGTIVIYFIKMTARTDYVNRGISVYEKYTGLVARTVTVTSVILGAKYHPAFFLVAPVGEGLRLAHVMSNSEGRRQYHNVYYLDVLISFVYAAVIGAALAFV